MAVLYIAEFDNIGTSMNGQPIQQAALPPIAESTTAIGGTSTQSAVFNARTQFVRVHTDAICSVAFGTNPTATATNARLAAGSTEYFVVPKGGSFRAAVITNT